jgi:LytS/YehU family sensor histidine kinase
VLPPSWQAPETPPSSSVSAGGSPSDLAVPEEARRCAVPPLLVHALVENAVKHGLRTSTVTPVEIQLTASYDGGALRIEVCNMGRITEGGDGVGLRNVADRLNAMYPGRHSFALVERDGAVRATMEIRSPRVLS